MRDRFSYLFTGNNLDCSGCRACEQICKHKAIEIIENSEGFLYPKINENLCIGCGLCDKICPFNPSVERSKDNLFTQKYLGVFAKDKDIARKSATVGVCTIMSQDVIRKGGVVCGSFLDERKSYNEHIIIDSLEQVSLIQGSKYMQSDTNSTFSNIKDILEQQRDVLYIGTPCQIAGLNAFLKKKYNNLLTIDLVCHGVFSKKIYQKELKALERKYNGIISNFRFRSKEYFPWSFGGVINFDINSKGKIRHVEIPARFSPMYYCYAYTDDGDKYTLRESCYNCKFRNMNRVADITVGDLWGFSKYYKLTQDQLFYGLSFVTINSTKGEEMFANIKHQVDSFLTTAEKSVLQPDIQGVHRNIPSVRKSIYDNLDKMVYEELVAKYIFPYNYNIAYKKFIIKYKAMKIVKKTCVYALYKKIKMCLKSNIYG